MPFLQLIPPANPYALALDHDYMNLTPQDQFFKDNHVCVHHYAKTLYS